MCSCKYCGSYDIDHKEEDCGLLKRKCWKCLSNVVTKHIFNHDANEHHVNHSMYAYPYFCCEDTMFACKKCGGTFTKYTAILHINNDQECIFSTDTYLISLIAD